MRRYVIQNIWNIYNLVSRYNNSFLPYYPITLYILYRETLTLSVLRTKIKNIFAESILW